MMCKVPTTISPVVIRLPHLRVLEGVAAGLRADVKQTASMRGHRMLGFSAGNSHCTACLMEVSVEHVHPFKNEEKGLVYKGMALDYQCPGKHLAKDSLLLRVPATANQVKGASP